VLYREAHVLLEELTDATTGTGKSWRACALGQRACWQGHSVRHVRGPRLVSEELVHARADGSCGKLMQTLAKTALLILD